MAEIRSMDVPPMVKAHGKITLNWQPFDFEHLHKWSRIGWTLEEIAHRLPCLWFFQPPLRLEILEQSLAVDELVRRCLHPNVGSGIHCALQPGEVDLLLSEAELLEFQTLFTSLRNALLEMPKAEYERICGILLEELTKPKRVITTKPTPTAAATPTMATLTTSDCPKRRSAGGQNRCSESEVDRRILQLCRSAKGESLAQVGKVVSPLQNRAKESNQTLKQCTLARVEGLAAEGLGEIVGEGKKARFRAFVLDVPELQEVPTGLQQVRQLCSVA